MLKKSKHIWTYIILNLCAAPSFSHPSYSVNYTALPGNQAGGDKLFLEGIQETEECTDKDIEKISDLIKAYEAYKNSDLNYTNEILALEQSEWAAILTDIIGDFSQKMGAENWELAKQNFNNCDVEIPE